MMRGFLPIYEEDKHKHSTYEPSFSITMDEEAHSDPFQEIKNSYSSRDFAIQPSIIFQTNIPPFETNLDEE